MRKYYCDVCNTEISQNGVYVDSLDFGRGNVELCNSCYNKFKSAKLEVYATYSQAYDSLDSDYFDDIKEIILAEPQVEPTIEEEPVGTGHRPTTDEEVGA